MNFNNLTEAAQKTISHLKSKVKVQNVIIDKEKEVISQKGDTYVCKRAKKTLESAERKLTNAETDYETSLAELDKQYKLDKESLLKTHKAYLEKQQFTITQQLDIINGESTSKTPTIIRCEVEIKSLEAEIKSILDNESYYTTSTSTPLTQAPKISEAPKICSEWEQMMKDEKELEALRAARPSYIVDFSIPKTDTVYGAVSTLPPKTKRPVKSVKIINSATNLYSDEVEE